MNSKIRGLALSALLLVGAAACTVEKVDEAHVGVKYTDGPIEGKKWDGVVEPGGSHTVANDHVYQLPARQVTYIAGSNSDGQQCAECERPALTLTAKGGERMDIELAVRFFLNTRTTPLRPFFLEICQKHNCWSDDGWIRMLNETFGNPMEAVVNDVGLDFDAEQLRYDNKVKDEFAAAFASTFVESQKRLIGHGDYFCGPGYDRKDKESCPGLSVEVTGVEFHNTEREGIREAQELSVKQAALASQQEATAVAQQRVNAAKATNQYLALQQAEAMLACAKNPQGCNLTVIVGDDGDVGVSVPTG